MKPVRNLYFADILNDSGGTKIALNLCTLLDTHKNEILWCNIDLRTSKLSNCKIYPNKIALPRALFEFSLRGRKQLISMLRCLHIFLFPIWMCNIILMVKRNSIKNFISHDMYTYIPLTFIMSFFCHTYLVMHNSPKDVYANRRFSIWRRYLAKIFLRRTNVILIAQDMQKELRDLAIRPRSINVIFNPVIDENGHHGERVKKDYKKLIFVGALNVRKRVHILIHLMRFLPLDYRLYIYGDGPERVTLENLSLDEELTDRVFFMGYKDGIMREISSAGCLLLSSASEGLPTVLIEALSCGTIPVSVDCPTGPREILKEKFEQYLVTASSDEGIIVERMAKIVLSINERNYPTINSFSHSINAYTFQKVKKVWNSILH